MIPKSLFNSSIAEVNAHAGVVIGACGYETRSAATIERLADRVSGRFAIAFEEHPNEFSRQANERRYKEARYELRTSGGSSTTEVEDVVALALEQARGKKCALAFDISSMTRAWHGAIIRKLMEQRQDSEIETYFIYVPGKYTPPPTRNAPNEIVGPVDGFASLSPPDLPIALLMSLGYERERALGLMEILDPGRTVLLLAHMNARYLESVIKSNQEVLERTQRNWIFGYPLREPAASFGILESICGGLDRTYRIVLASLGPKLFGILCFLLAAKNRSLSVWRMSSGIHGQPRDVLPDIDKIVVLKTIWAPEHAE